jgi:DNA repair protein SbcC/Rad50
MTPLSFTITGAHGIRCGLGRETLTMDLTQIPDDALTVALKGVNGAGKSTILNLALVPWREPPVAGGVYAQFGDAGLRELIWTHAGTKYRTRIEYRNTGKTKTQRAYLHQYNGVYDWQPVELPDHTVSNGLSSTYDACLTHILGDQAIYYLSAFRAQGAPKLAEYDDPKGLMRALLNLDEPAALSERARDVTRELRRALDGVRDQAKALDEHPDRIAALESLVETLAVGVPLHATSKLLAQDTAARARAELDRAMAGDLDRQRLIEQRAAVQARLTATEASGRRAVAQATEAHRVAVERITATKNRWVVDRAAMERDIKAAQDRADSASAVLAKRDAILAAEEEVTRIGAEIEVNEQTAANVAEQIRSLRDLAGQVRTLETQRDHAAADGKTCKGLLDSLTARAGFVAVVPCHGEGIYAECPALKEAKAAEGQIPGMQTAVDTRRAEWRAIDAQIHTLGVETAELTPTLNRHTTIMAVINDLRGKLTNLRAVAAQGHALVLAEQNLAEANAAVAELTTRLAGATFEHTARLTELDGELATAAQARDDAVIEMTCVVSEIRSELDNLPEPDTDQAVTMARQELAQAESAVQAAQSAIDQATAAKAQHEAEIASLRAALEAGAEVVAKAKRLEAEIADWQLLGMGLRGVVDLSIEAAGPGISAIANDLLATAYGPRFSVRIVTQREQANGKTVETFDVSVIDSESGMESSILQKSGGEAVILDRCLTDAAALYQQDTAGIHYEVAFADEADGALSEENRRLFYSMERRAMSLGRYGRKYFVSHNAEAWDMADHVIDLAQYREAV